MPWVAGMLSRPGGRARRSRLSRARVPGAACALLAVLLLSGIMLAGGPPARADSVRTAQLWALDAINAPAAWPVSRGAGVTVAVIDSGVNGQVPDLAGSVINGPDYTGVHTSPDNPAWGIHGTWMASLVAGHGHDGDSGILGSAPRARVLSVRVITDRLDPGYSAYERQPLRRGQQELADAIRYAVRRRVGVISMSLGYGTPSRPVRTALQDAYAHRVVVVASSGNSGTAAGASGRGTAPYSFPADYPGVLGVAAVGQNWQPASFSSDNFSVQVAAPGVSVPAQGRDGQYWLVSGTSPACALTAGVAALVKARYPQLSDAQVITAITSSTWHRPPRGYDKQVGFGTVDAAAALTAAGRLARRGTAGRAGAGSPAARGRTRRSVSAAARFGGGLAGIPPSPVPPRGVLALVLYGLLGTACLAVVALAAARLVVSRPPPGWRLVAIGGGDDHGGDDHGGGEAGGDDDHGGNDHAGADDGRDDGPADAAARNGSGPFSWSSTAGRHAGSRPWDDWPGSRP